jgi:pilus assembly protein Flp/PilA
MFRIGNFLSKEDGATAIEYGFIASLIAVAIVGVLLTLGPTLAAAFQRVENSFNNP